jgi:hypothetical protein
MSNAPDGRGLATDDFDEDEIDWGDDNGPDDGADDENGLSPIEGLVDEGSDIFDDNDLGDNEDDDEDRD